MVIGVSVGLTTVTPMHHNQKEHAALCDVLGTVVAIFESGRGGTKLQRALSRAILGNENGGTGVRALLGTLPQEFHNPGNRHNWCGSCGHGGKDHYPGKSIPHDLLCLCTVGGDGYPFYANSDGAPTLCGKNAKDLLCGQAEGKHCASEARTGWSEQKFDEKVKNHLNATWGTVVKTCLGKKMKFDLDTARNTLMEQLKPKDGYTSPIWARGHTYCGGINGDVCVSYGSCSEIPGFPQWQEGLYEALEKADFTQTELTSAVSHNASTEDGQTDGQYGPNEDYPQGTQQENHGVQQRSKRSTNPTSHHSEQQSCSIPAQPLWLLSELFFY
nr:VSG [Trypanosoma congolense IL3000]